MNYSHVSKCTAELLEGMQQAGFTDESIYEFIRKIPNPRFSEPYEYHLRKLYLLHLGLGQFSLAPAKFKMFDPYEAGIFPLGYLEVNNLLIEEEDQRRITGTIDIPNLDLCDSFIGKEKEVLLSAAIRRISDSAIQFADVTHLEWLVRHREFIPQTWVDILMGHGSIIFPGVKLVGTDSGKRDNPIAYYPSMSGVRGHFGVEWSLKYFHVSGSSDKYPSKMIRGQHFFAHFGVQKKVEAT